MWAAYVLYPAYRAKNGHVNTLAERLQGCFRYSMNGKPPAADDPVLTALQTYMFWLASKAPTGVTLEGQGYRKLPAPAQKADYLRGEKVYAQYCAVCHGAEGQEPEERQALGLPRLMGADSFNWGAGMHQIGNAAGFIKANMPLGQAGMLSDQEAWDVAYFANAHERPQDPRYAESVAATRAKYHDSDDSLYGIEVNGHLLGSDSPRPAASCCRRPSPEPLKTRRGGGFRPAAPLICYSCGLGITLVIYSCANSGNVFMVVAPSGAANPAWSGPCSSKTLPSCSRFPAPRARRVPAKTVANTASWRSTISSACATNEPLLEWAEVHGNFYSTPATASTPPPAKDAMCCSRSTGRGARQVKQRFPGAIGIFILPPSIEELEARLKARGQDEPQVIARRLMAAGGEIAHAPECEYVIINQNLA